MVASGKRGDQRLIVVVGGLESAKEREAEARRLLDWGFKSFKPFRLFDAGQTVSDALVWGGTKHYVPLVGNGDINIILPANATGKVAASIVYQGPIKAPIRKGDQVAVLRVTSAESQATNEIPLYAGDDIGQSNFAMRGLDSSAGACLRLAAVAMQRESGDTGRFITFEGGEGSGKSTQAGILANRLTRAGRKVFATREPGGSPAAEEIREALLSGRVSQFGPFAEAVMFAVARADHVENAIGQALHEGKWVVCDRFFDSTRAYQGATAGVPRGLINALERLTVGDLSPDITFILDIPPEAGTCARRRARATAPRPIASKARS